MPLPRHLQALPPIEPLSDPDSAFEHVQTLADQSRHMQMALSQYLPVPIATQDGRVLRVLAIGRDDQLHDPWPEPQLTATPSGESSLTVTALLANAHSRALDLESIATSFVFQPFTTDEDGYEVEALAQHCGYTEACPMQIHYLPQSRQWLCIGSFLRQSTFDGFSVDFRIPTAQFHLHQGHIGLQLTLRGGLASGPDAVYHRVTAAEWQTRQVTDGGSSTLGSISNATANAGGTLFIPLFAVSLLPTPRAFRLPILVPVEPGRFVPRLNLAALPRTLLSA